MGVHLRALNLRALLEEGDLAGARAFAFEILRAGGIDDETAVAIADVLEAKPRKGRPADKRALQIAQTIRNELEAITTCFPADLGEQGYPDDFCISMPVRYGDLKAAIAVAEDKHKCTRRQAEHAWALWKDAFEESARVQLEVCQGFDDISQK